MSDTPKVEEPAAEEPERGTLDARRDELVAELHERIARSKPRPLPSMRRRVSLQGIRMRTLLLPAFAIVLFLAFGSRAGAPLGVEAAFTPGPGTSFAGPRVFDVPEDAPPGPSVRLAPGDLVGARSGAESVLEVGHGRLRLQPGARAVLASLMPPRVRLIGGRAEASGRLRIVTANGIVDLDDGRALLYLSEDGLDITLVEGEGSLIAPDATVELELDRLITVR